jgi:hypothetical protein
VGPRSFGKVANGRQGSARSSYDSIGVPLSTDKVADNRQTALREGSLDCLTPPRASQIIAEKTADDIGAYVHANEGRWMMPTAVKMEVSPETIIRAVKGMKKSVRRAFMENLIAATSPEYLQSIRDARRDFKTGKVKSHGEVFGR